ncbi:MAG: hypothetical protein K2X77_13480, partial [Candidatus Obscuribacterales bacterium]|nr:hypothetical protein [Candidatus Obscuribacterales bacterium]
SNRSLNIRAPYESEIALEKLEAGKMAAVPGSNRSLNIRAPYESEIALEKLEAGKMPALPGANRSLNIRAPYESQSMVLGGPCQNYGEFGTVGAMPCVTREYSKGLLSDLIEIARRSSSLPSGLQDELRLLGRTVIDCSGTGGSGLPHFNTSTSSAFVLAAAGLKVAKFGGRAASSKSGSFDFLEGLGFTSNLPCEAIADGIESCGVVFILAAEVYPQLKRLAPIRKKIARPTAINFIGPLLNPLNPGYRVMGISSDSIRSQIAEYLASSYECNHALLVTADSRIDELLPVGRNSLSRIENGLLSEEILNTSYVISKSEYTILDAAENVEIFGRILTGEDCSSTFYYSLLLNSAAGLMVGGIVDSINAGVDLAKGLVSSGQVAATLERARRFYGRFS